MSNKAKILPSCQYQEENQVQKIVSAPDEGAGPTVVGGRPDTRGLKCPSQEPILEVESETNAKATPEDSKYSKYAKFATLASWAVNWFLLGIKGYAAITTLSKSVIASLADSGADLVSQAILSAAEHYKNKKSTSYPVGRARLEDMSVLGCAAIMILISIEVCQESAIEIDEGLRGKVFDIPFGPADITILVVGIFLKFVLWLYCGWANKYLHSDALAALTEDHFNDLLSNTAAITAALIASHVKHTWWVDPLGAIALMLLIAWRWCVVIAEQMKKIVGHTAPEEFLKNVDDICNDHHRHIVTDAIVAYHFGSKFIVEIEMVLPGTMSVMETFEIARGVTAKVEELEDVVRCHVHVDFLQREAHYHKTERELGVQRVKRPKRERRKSTKNQRTGMPRRNSYFGKLENV